MSSKIGTKQDWSLASVALLDSWTDFMLSRQAMQCSIETLRTYQHTAGKFLQWLEGQGVSAPDEVSARHVRAYLASMRDRGLADTTMHDHARAIRTLLRFWHREKYMPELVTFEMPRVAKKRLPVLSGDDLKRVLLFCGLRDRALILLMADSGLRRAEVCALDWEDIDFGNGLLRVKRGKGGKARSAVVGVTTRRALLAYRRIVEPSGPMFRTEKGTRKGERIQPDGLGVMCNRLSKRSGIRVTPHALRRTFVILSLRAGMSPTHLQALGGWSGIEMVSHYAQLEDIDLLQAHKEHSPIDHLRPRRAVRPKRRRRG